jgi:hypothetical protein
MNKYEMGVTRLITFTNCLNSVNEVEQNTLSSRYKCIQLVFKTSFQWGTPALIGAGFSERQQLTCQNASIP